MMTVIFSHGQESGPWGTKITSMAGAVEALGCSVASIDYRGIPDPTERVDKLVTECRSIEGPRLLVGSSMGGHVATVAATEVGAVGLFVLAPAYFIPGYEALTPAPPDLPICIVHGWRDDVVPVGNSIRFAQSCRAEMHIVDADHRLTENIDEINYYLRRFIEKIAPRR
jgi:alpha/beta superfamily hydrolase